MNPFLGTVVLTALPELVAPLAKLGNLFYGLLLLAVARFEPVTLIGFPCVRRTLCRESDSRRQIRPIDLLLTASLKFLRFPPPVLLKS